MGLGDKWGGFRGPAWWNETFSVTLGDTGLGHGVGLGGEWGMVLRHGVGLGDQHGVGLGASGEWGWDMGWV